MAITVQQISRRAKATRGKNEPWLHAIKRASKELKGSAGKKRKVGKVKRHKRVRGVSTRSRSHTDKNKITANIQVGSIASHKAAIRTKVKDRLAKQLLRREMATRKTDRRKISKSIRQTKSELNKYC